ncbi:MAG: NAD(P)-dependent glycerol-3-phosphate dehydrogenase [Akkermansiaceae bacterium]|nr:NAD(P)-dependent glycerol-3-phosphate dehydrogenase [Akkermansiaceae bacterium]
MNTPFTSVAILGAGSLGTALAKLLSPKLDSILLVSIEADVVAGINRDHRNPKYLTDIELPANIRATMDHREVVGFPLVLVAVPSSAVRAEAGKLVAAGLPATTPLLSCAKGIERDTGKRLSQVIGEVLPENPVGVLTGPNHAEEIALGMVSCAVVASHHTELADALQDLFTLPYFRVYTSDDVAGVELGGAVKNVYAIAAGMGHGLKVGDNAVAALVTRALAEMTRLGVALGGRPETFSGLSGVGDLMVTCFSEHSRNHRVGHAIGCGKTLEEAVAALGMVAEGVPNALSIHDVARKLGVRTPIIDGIHAILYEGKPAAVAMREVLARDPRPEIS